MVWPAIIAAAGSIAGGLLGNKGAKDAAKEQSKAAKINAELQKWLFEQQTALQAPFREAGLTGQDRYLTLLGLKSPTNSQNALDPNFGKYARDFSMQDFEQDPGYAFRLSEGLKALDRQAAARGGLISGAALKAASNYGQESASQEYTNAFNRYQTNRANQLNPLAALQGIGQTTTNQMNQSAQNYGQQAGQAYTDMGNARASGYMGQANALAGALQGAGNTFMQYQMMNQLLNQNPGSYGGNPYVPRGYNDSPGGLTVDYGTGG